MSTPDPFRTLGLNGDGLFRSVTLKLPVAQVRRFLPSGIELGPQDVTPSGTHPVIISFNQLSRVRTAIPTLLPTLDYNEYTFGIPYTWATRGMVSRDTPGPYYFMPRLFLDSFFAVMGGVMFWGYAKQSANFALTHNRCEITSMTGDPLTALAWKSDGDYAPIERFPEFTPIRKMLDQPLVSMMPVTLGPFPVIADFEKQWTAARLRPIETSLDVSTEFIDGFHTGSYPESGFAPGIDTSVLGSYEYTAPWRLGIAMPLPVIP